jgi:hypothetical protein
MVTMKDFGTFDQPLSTLHEKKEDSRELERKKIEKSTSTRAPTDTGNVVVASKRE